MARRIWQTGALAAATVGACAVLTASPNDAGAQLEGIATEYNLERFRLASDRNGILDVESASVLAHRAIDVAAWLGYADDPLNVYREGAIERERVGSLVSHRLGGNLIGAIGLFDRVQMGVDVPLIFSQDQSTGQLMGGPASLSSFGLGDVRLLPKVAVLRQADRGLDLAIAANVTLPTGTSEDYLGERTVTLAPEILISAALAPVVRGGINIGYRIRKQQEALGLEVDDELYAHVGVGYAVHERVELDATFSLATAADNVFGAFNRNHSELRGGVVVKVGGVSVFAAAGAGTSQGFGTPDWRGVLGARFGHGGAAAPPSQLPESDAGVIAASPPPERSVELQSDTTLPEPHDTDGDGLNDAADRCAGVAEDFDGFEDGDGCPDPDNDDDGVPDLDDKCPLARGTAARQGCPIADRDKDGIEDSRDNCPGVAGTSANRGCTTKQLVELTDAGLVVLTNVDFDTDQARIRPRSYAVLRNVADIVVAHPELGNVSIVGHTDDRGSEDYNRELSSRRAAAVLDFLVAQGVPAARLKATGAGETQPIAPNATEAERAKNRRVEFRVANTAP